MTQFISFPKIKQFKDCIHNIGHKARWRGLDEDGKVVFDREAVLPKLKFRGTVKLHGTNASVVLHPDGEFVSQSRKRICTIENDNQGFAVFAHGKKDIFLKLFERFGEDFFGEPATIYGEWCGGNIQGGVGLSQVSAKKFIIFAIRVGLSDDARWLNLKDRKFESFESPEHEIYNINSFPVWEKEIDFNSPAVVRNEIVDLTMGVEAECPVAKAFGVENGVGEGVVWKCTEPGFESSDFWFKVKGEKHSSSNVKTLASVDPEKMKNVQEFVEYSVTENRLNQGIDFLKEVNAEFSMKSTGVFLKWLVSDIASEESDVMAESELSLKDISKAISIKGRTWFFKYLDES